MRFRFLLLVALFGYLKSPTLAGWAAPWSGLAATLMLSVGIYGAWCAFAARRRTWKGAQWEQGEGAEEFGEAALTALFGLASAGRIWGIETANGLIVGIFLVSAIFAGDALMAWLRGRPLPERVGNGVMSAVAAALGLLFFVILPFEAAPTTAGGRKGGFETVEQACLAQMYQSSSQERDRVLVAAATECTIVGLVEMPRLGRPQEDDDPPSLPERSYLGQGYCHYRDFTLGLVTCEVKQCADGFIPPLHEGQTSQQDC